MTKFQKSLMSIKKSKLIKLAILSIALLSACFFVEYQIEQKPYFVNGQIKAQIIQQNINSVPKNIIYHNNTFVKPSFNLSSINSEPLNSLPYFCNFNLDDNLLKDNTYKKVVLNNEIVNLPLEKNGSSISIQGSLINTFIQAGNDTDIDYKVLLSLAYNESRFNPLISNGSAVGLFQFQPNTWLSMIATHGLKTPYLATYVKYINQDKTGKYYVTGGKYNEIMNLRKNASDSIYMAAYYLKDNKTMIEAHFNQKTTNTDIVLSHVLGVNGAIKLIGAYKTRPNLATNQVVASNIMKANGIKQQPVSLTYENLKLKYKTQIELIRVAINSVITEEKKSA